MLDTSQDSRARDGEAITHAGSGIYAALDLGTNNCRLLVASVPDSASTSAPPLKILDSFSRIVRLGEGVSATGMLSDEAMARTLAALVACQKKIAKYRITRARYVATEACRRAKNGMDFIRRVQQETGLSIDIITSEEEAKLAFMGCASLLSPNAPRAVVFDIGGGSTELMWVNLEGGGDPQIDDWLSVGFGVMNLADKFGGSNFADMAYGDMVNVLTDRIRPFDASNNISRSLGDAKLQLLSTSGTVTTLAAIHLDLPRYDRSRIDGIRLPVSALRDTTQRLLAMRPSERFNHPCIGPDRADFIISGCAIFDAISRLWPAGEITIADRGVREGIILSLIKNRE